METATTGQTPVVHWELNQQSEISISSHANAIFRIAYCFKGSASRYGAAQATMLFTPSPN